MIRPITCVTFLLACASGMYLYQAKQRVRVLDRQIMDVVHQTEQVREQERVLRAQWALLDEPGRLQALSTQFLSLQPTKQSQYTSESEMDQRLPSVEQPKPPSEAPDAASQAIASLPPPAAPQPAPAPPERKAMPTAGIAVASAAASGTEHLVQHVEEHARVGTPAHEPIRRVSAQLPIEAHPVPARPQFAVIRREAPLSRPVPMERSYTAVPAPRPMPRYASSMTPVAAQPRYAQPQYTYSHAAPRPVQAGYGGSLLGMARSAAPPPPTPAPAPAWQNWSR